MSLWGQGQVCGIMGLHKTRISQNLLSGVNYWFHAPFWIVFAACLYLSALKGCLCWTIMSSRAFKVVRFMNAGWRFGFHTFRAALKSRTKLWKDFFFLYQQSQDLHNFFHYFHCSKTLANKCQREVKIKEDRRKRQDNTPGVSPPELHSNLDSLKDFFSASILP